MAYGQQLHRNRSGTWCFRAVIPARLRPALGRTEISVSLRTSDKREAVMRSLELRAAVGRLLAAARELPPMAQNDPHALAALIAKHQVKVLKRELGETDELLRDRAAETERLTAQVARQRDEADELRRELLARMASPFAPVALALPPGPTLDEAIAAYITEHTAKGSWTPKSLMMVQQRLQLLTDWFGQTCVGSLTRADMVTFFEALKSYPKNANKYATLAPLTMKQRLDVPGLPKLSGSSVNQIMERVSSFFAWMSHDPSRWHVRGNIAASLQIANVETIERQPFTPSDLRTLLSAPEWRAKTFLHSYYYWLIPMGLLVGARINELCQLRLQDFGEHDGVPFLSIAASGQRAKTRNATRQVPIHSELIRLGLLRHVERLRTAGETMLFPECKEKRDGHGQDASRWFSKYKRRLGINDPEKVFHSTRHGFASVSVNSGTSDTTTNALIGHSNQSLLRRVYWSDRAGSIVKFRDDVERVSYPVLTELVPPVEEVTFGTDIHRLARRPPLRRPAV